MLGALGVMIIILAVLALVVVKALAHSPWGVFSIAATIPIALFMGIHAFIRPGKLQKFHHWFCFNDAGDCLWW
jgi:carbon starvation protein